MASYNKEPAEHHKSQTRHIILTSFSGPNNLFRTYNCIKRTCEYSSKNIIRSQSLPEPRSSHTQKPDTPSSKTLIRSQNPDTDQCKSTSHTQKPNNPIIKNPNLTSIFFQNPNRNQRQCTKSTQNPGTQFRSQSNSFTTNKKPLKTPQI